jgi:hypothetical protein
MRFNPYGPAGPTRGRSARIAEIIENRDLSVVCGVHYVLDYEAWKDMFDRL